jgi:hypothetical protein
VAVQPDGATVWDRDPATNRVTFALEDARFQFEADPRDEDVVRVHWNQLVAHHQVTAEQVRGVHSTWQPSAADLDLLLRDLPGASVTWSFQRPGPDGWEVATADARRRVEQAIEQARAEDLRRTYEEGVLLPVLRSVALAGDILQVVPYRELVPGRLCVTLAAVAMTPRGTLGMRHLGLPECEASGSDFDGLLAESYQNLTENLRIDGQWDRDRGDLLVLERPGLLGSSALALPDFQLRMASVLEDDQLVVGVQSPDRLYVTPADSGWVEWIEQLVATAEVEWAQLAPVMLRLDPAGMQVLSDRQDLA